MTLRLGLDGVDRAAAIIAAGGLVAFPTETVYGLGADASSEAAVGRIFSAKGRPTDNPLIVHIARPESAAVYGRLNATAETLAARFWPGPLTLVVTAIGPIAAAARAGLPTVALRCPDHPVALALLSACGLPVAAPSANRSGRPSPTAVSDVLEDLDGAIDAVLDGGPCRIGVESTVVDCSRRQATILRPGGVPVAAIEAVIGPVGRPGDGGGPPRSPGMRYRHYAPLSPVLLAGPGASAVAAALHRYPDAAVLCTKETADELGLDGDRLAILGTRAESSASARALFAALRRLDRLRPGVIVAESLPEEGVGAAVMDRLRRAAASGP